MTDLKKSLLIVTCFSIIAPGNICAQDTLSRKELRVEQANFFLPGKPFTFEVPLWVPGFAGSFAHGDVEIEGEDGMDPVNPIEPPDWPLDGIFSRLFSTNWFLRFFYLTKFSYESDRFLVQMDAVTGAVGGTLEFRYTGNQIVLAKFSSTNFRLFGGYKIVNTTSCDNSFQYEFIGYLGTRVFLQSVSSDLGSDGNTLSFRANRLEPVLGIQNQFTWKRWLFIVQGDYGRMFAAHKKSVQVSGYVYYRHGKLISFKAGWNHLYLDHSGIFLKQDYSLKATFSGPSTGVVFHF